MGPACNSPIVGSGQQIENFCRVNIVPALECKI